MSKLSVIFIVISLSVVTVIANDPDNGIVSRINTLQNYWRAEHNHVTKQGMNHMKRILGTILPKDLEKIERQKTQPNDNIPYEFDSRSQWPDCKSISAIRDQGDCGSCWAVAAATAATDRLCIQTNTQIAVNLSTENLMSCCRFCSIFGGCNGGYPSLAWTFLKYFGITTGGDYDSAEGCQPYEIPPTGGSKNGYESTPECHYYCPNERYSTPYLRDKHRTKSYYSLENSVSAIQTEVMNNGPVDASMKVYDDFMYYCKGVYVQSTTDYIGSHSVKLIGWGHDDSSKLDYWLVANSWNTSWGEKGFFRIRRGTNECGIEDYIMAGNF